MIAAVYGPLSTAAWKEDPEKAIIEVTFMLDSNPAGVPLWHLCVLFQPQHVPFCNFKVSVLISYSAYLHLVISW